MVVPLRPAADDARLDHRNRCRRANEPSPQGHRASLALARTRKGDNTRRIVRSLALVWLGDEVEGERFGDNAEPAGADLYAGAVEIKLVS